MKPILFQDDAFKDFIEWNSKDKEIFQRINELIKDIDRDFFKGIGKPEPLKHNLSGYWSRRINDEHRLVYKIENGTVIIVKCKGHYKDK